MCDGEVVGTFRGDDVTTNGTPRASPPGMTTTKQRDMKAATVVVIAQGERQRDILMATALSFRDPFQREGAAS